LRQFRHRCVALVRRFSQAPQDHAFELAERELRPRLPDLPWPALEIVRAKVDGLVDVKG